MTSAGSPLEKEQAGVPLSTEVNQGELLPKIPTTDLFLDIFDNAPEGEDNTTQNRVMRLAQENMRLAQENEKLAAELKAMSNRLEAAQRAMEKQKPICNTYLEVK